MEGADGAQAFLPQLYVDVTEAFERKLEALRLYEIEMRAYPHPRSYRAVCSLAEYRGCTAGAVLAEAFAVGGIIR